MKTPTLVDFSNEELLILKHILDRCSELPAGTAMTLSTLYGKEKWDSEVKRHVYIGRLVSELVKAGHLPLVRAGKDGSRNHQLYRIDHSVKPLHPVIRSHSVPVSNSLAPQVLAEKAVGRGNRRIPENVTQSCTRK